MEWLGPLGAAVATLATAAVGVAIANRAGLGSVQQQYMEVVTALSDQRQERIEQLEHEFEGCRQKLDDALKRVARRAEQVDELKQEVDDLRDDLRQLRRQLGT